jgi:nitrogenase iron protein NifH
MRGGDSSKLSNLVVPGYRGIACVEVGDSLAEDECATRSIGRALNVLQESGVLSSLSPDYVIYDIPGEVGCAGITTHLNISLRDRTYIVTSGDLMSFYAANAFIRNLSRQSEAASVSLIGNALTGSFEESFVTDFARQLNVNVAGLIPRSLVVRHSELYGKTVIESAPDSTQAQTYRRLAQQILANREDAKDGAVRSLSVPELRSWAQGWGDRLGELEFGIIRDGAGI